jgi:hypothetical protein
MIALRSDVFTARTTASDRTARRCRRQRAARRAATDRSARRAWACLAVRRDLVREQCERERVGEAREHTPACALAATVRELHDRPADEIQRHAHTSRRAAAANRAVRDQCRGGEVDREDLPSVVALGWRVGSCATTQQAHGADHRDAPSERSERSPYRRAFREPNDRVSLITMRLFGEPTRAPTTRPRRQRHTRGQSHGRASSCVQKS